MAGDGNTCVWIFVCMCMHVFLKYIYTSLHARAYTNTHTHIHTHAHTHTQLNYLRSLQIRSDRVSIRANSHQLWRQPSRLSFWHPHLFQDVFAQAAHVLMFRNSDIPRSGQNSPRKCLTYLGFRISINENPLSDSFARDLALYMYIYIYINMYI